MGRKLAEGVQFSVTIIGGLIYGFWSSWRVSLLVLTCVPFMAVSTAFLLKMNQTQTARANSSYAKAGAIVYMAVSSIRTILSLNAVESVIHKFMDATQEAFEGATNQVFLVGLANGAVMGTFLLSYMPVTLYGSYLLYSHVRQTGCDPSGGAIGNEKCVPAAVGVFGALFGITFAGAVLPQVSVALEAFVGARSAAYPALLAMSRKTAHTDDDDEDNNQQQQELLDAASLALQKRGSIPPLPKFVIDSSSPRGRKLDSVQGTITFDNVTFCYPTRAKINVFDGFDLTIPAGKTVALVGPR